MSSLSGFTPAKSIFNPSVSLPQKNPASHFFNQFNYQVFTHFNGRKYVSRNDRLQKASFVLLCTDFSSSTIVSEAESDYEIEQDSDFVDEEAGVMGNGQAALPVPRRRRRYRKEYPGEKRGISEEMRFVAMKLRNSFGKKSGDDSAGVEELENDAEKSVSFSLDAEKHDGNLKNRETWNPSIEGFLKYLVDSELVFSTIERIVDESSDVSYVYFRKTGLERSDSLSRDLEWFGQQGNALPQPSSPGITYVQYLEELAETSPPLFLGHFYNIYFSHIAGGQVIAKQVSEKILEGKELEFYKWDRNAEALLQRVRENLNALGEHWSRDEKNKCLKETTKAFRFLGQIVRLIILTSLYQ